MNKLVDTNPGEGAAAEGTMRALLDGITDRRLFMVVALPLVALFLATATWSRPYHVDAFSNVLPAWNLGTKGSFLLDEHEDLTGPDYYRNIAWVVPARETAASQYPPGAALIAAPLYAVWPGDAETVTVRGTNRPDVAPVEVLMPPLGPAAVAAALAVAPAIGLLGVAFRRVGGSASTAIAGAFIAGLGTSAWSVASDQLWQHGPAMAWIALGVVLSSRGSLAPGLAFGAAILTRPPTALVAAASGIYRSVRHRTIRPVFLTGVGAAIGLLLFLIYNSMVFGDTSVSAGYGTSFQDQARSLDVVGYAKNVFLGVFSATRGFLIWSPFLLVLLPGIRAGWKAAPAWVRGASLGGVLYLLLQYKANRFSGGAGFFTYRYPLEALTAAAPLLFLAYREWVASRPRAVRAFAAMAGFSVILHGLGALDLLS
ncbi:MAG: hypothetical protein ACE5GC_08605 [Acidimicrobiia bacterium]